MILKMFGFSGSDVFEYVLKEKCTDDDIILDMLPGMKKYATNIIGGGGIVVAVVFLIFKVVLAVCSFTFDHFLVEHAYRVFIHDPEYEQELVHQKKPEDPLLEK
jgi:hypothetical protein